MEDKMVNFLFEFKKDLFNKDLWIVANRDNLGSVGFLMRKIQDDYRYKSRICSLDGSLIDKNLNGTIVESFDKADTEKSHFMICGKSWYLSYEGIKKEVDETDIFMFMEGWFEESDRCIVCGRQGQYKKYA